MRLFLSGRRVRPRFALAPFTIFDVGVYFSLRGRTRTKIVLLVFSVTQVE